MVVQTGDRRATAARIAAQLGSEMTTRPGRACCRATEEVLSTPFLLIGTIDETTEQVLRHPERHDLTYITVHDYYVEAFAPVIESLPS